jgi:hypothetical protein
MKRILIGALVGAILLFVWQSVAHMFMSHHNASMRQAPNSTAILSTLSENIKEEGQYLLPDVNHNASQEEMEATQKQMEGKPWAVITYHKAWKSDMATPIIRQFCVNLLAVALFIWVLGRGAGGFSNVFLKTLVLGFLIFLMAWYPQNIWMDVPWEVVQAELIDLLVSWGLCGLWLGWWLNRKTVR